MKDCGVWQRLRHRLGIGVLIVGVSWYGIACSSSTAGRQWTRSEVYFGLSTPDGAVISAEQWQTFVNEVITPQFPQGLSILETSGQWKNASGHIDREPGKLLVLIHPGNRETEQRVDLICKEYCQRFRQEAVMKVSSRARVAF